MLANRHSLLLILFRGFPYPSQMADAAQASFATQHSIFRVTRDFALNCGVHFPRMENDNDYKPVSPRFNLANSYI